MKIVFVGAGNLATHLAQELFVKGNQIVQVFSRTRESADSLAQLVKAQSIISLSDIFTSADLYVFSVKDAVLEDLLSLMPITSGMWVHTAGSVPLNVFGQYHSDYGVIYPFQTFTKSRSVDFSEVPIFVEANTAHNLGDLVSLCKTLSSKVIELSSEKRKYIHLCGVFACNFVNHMYAVSENILSSQNLPFDVLLPLIDETACKVHQLSPVQAQTGPAVRYDENVISRHLALLEDKDQKQIYELLSRNIHETNINNNKL